MGMGVEVFVSYSHKDERFRKQLETHLAPLRHEGVISDWSDRQILSGSEWAGEIDRRIKSAHAILLLISADFLDSKYCYEIEMQRALQRHDAGETRVIPIVIRPCDWKNSPFAKLQVLPKDGKPIASWDDDDEAFLNVCTAIRATIREIRASIEDSETSSRQMDDESDPDWHKKLDRIEQTGAVRYLVDDMLKLGKPTCTCFCWYGGSRDGVDLFHDRLVGELDDVSRGRSWAIRPEWPAVVNRRGFCDTLTLALGVSNPADIRTSIRQHFSGRQDRRQLLYVNHTPVDDNKRLNPHQFLEYLRWWDEAVLENLEPNQHVVLGVSFLVENHVKFRDAIDHIASIPAHPFIRLVFEMLPVLQRLKAEHLRTFFKRIKMQFHVDRQLQERAIKRILKDTNGEYDMVVNELEVLINDGFDAFKDLVIDKPAEPEFEDYGY